MDAQQREIIKSLVQIVWADGAVDERERARLGEILVQLGLDEDEVSEVGSMMTEAAAPDLASVLPDVESRHGIMKVLLAMSLADGDLAAAELRWINAMARQLDIAPEHLERLKSEAAALG